MTEIFILNVMPLSRVLFANGLIYFLYNCYLCLNAMQWSLFPYKSFMKWVSLRIVLTDKYGSRHSKETLFAWTCWF